MMKYPVFPHKNTPETPLFLGHRGFTPVAPENSLPSFEAAGRRGFWAIETDVRRTRDGVLVCCHNATTAARFDRELTIADCTYDELLSLTMAKGNGLERYSAEELRMPTFAQYLDICEKYGAVPFIESKEMVIEEIFAELRRRDMMGSSVMSSVNFDHILEARRLDDEIFIHHIFSNVELMHRLSEMGNAGLSYNYPDLDLLPGGLIEETHACGVKVCLRAGDSFETCHRMFALGLDYIPSNKIYSMVGDNL
jgi:glycerophosphoryl diester phosphodiesterase